MLAAGVLLATGCGGFTASPSVSPASFLLPGLGQARPVETDSETASDMPPLAALAPAR